jgi:hypothetical protein
MPQANALPIDRVVRMDIFFKIFVAKAAAKCTHGSLEIARIKVSEPAQTIVLSLDLPHPKILIGHNIWSPRGERYL